MATHPCFVAHYVINSDYPFGYLRCILCGLPDLHLLYNGVFIMGLCSSPLAYTILPSSAGGLTLFQSARLARLLRMPSFPLWPSSSSAQHCSATNRTRLSDLCVFRPSHTKVQDAPGSVSTNARTAFTKSSSVRVGFRYGFSIRPVATSKNPIRLVVPWRIYSNSMQAGLPGITGLSGYLCSNAWIPVISSMDTVWPPASWTVCASW